LGFIGERMQDFEGDTALLGRGFSWGGMKLSSAAEVSISDSASDSTKNSTGSFSELEGLELETGPNSAFPD
jgi:hypothetical protein